MNWGLSSLNHKSPAPAPTTSPATDEGQLMAYKVNHLGEAKWGDKLREAGFRGAEPERYDYVKEGEDDHPFPNAGGYGIMLALGGAAAVFAIYAM